MFMRLPLFLTAVCFSTILNGFASEVDSIGIESENDEIYILHRVEAGETLYSLSKRYHTPIEGIVENNQISENNLSVGAILRVPWRHSIKHTVAQGETLYSISKHHKVSIETIKSVNKLASNTLEVGMVLRIAQAGNAESATHASVLNSEKHVVGQSETLYSISKKYDLTLDDLKNWNQLEDYNVKAGDTLLISKPAKTETLADKSNEELNAETVSVVITTPDETEEPSVPKSMKPITENGIAAVITGTSDTKKYLALHPTASVGTIMKVRNEMTNLSVFVRVVGKLPPTGANNNVLIRLSEAAQIALGALDEKFRVELSYVPNQ